MFTSRKRTALVSAVGATALLLSACAGSAAPASTAGDATPEGEPISIGSYAPSSGSNAWPEVEAGVRAAEWYVNNELGGIGDRPLDVHTCVTNGSAESGVGCANEFVSAGYAFVLDPYDLSTGAGRPILEEAGIPWAGTVAGDPKSETAPYPTGFFFTGPLAITAAGLANIWEQEDVETASYAVTDAPSVHTYIDNVLIPLADALGVEMTIQYVDPAQANWAAVAAAQLQGEPDMTGSVSLPEEGCTQLFGALRQQDPDGKIFVGSCSQYIDELGPDAAGTYTVPRLWSPLALDHAPEAVAAEIEAFTDAMAAVGAEDQISARATYAFAGLVTAARALATVEGDVTAESVTAALEGIAGEQMFLGPQITCDGEQWPGAPTACSSQSIYFVVQQDGTLKPGDAEGFTDLSQVIIDTLT
ncbi:hypothetical protein ACTU3I_00145 [Microbacterium sp. RD1]|uniref:hypothetical protein n=1 Tax=Microbacterium sp. RD1 TaxID=3457313 RepID=UPI003FA534AE